MKRSETSFRRDASYWRAIDRFRTVKNANIIVQGGTQRAVGSAEPIVASFQNSSRENNILSVRQRTGTSSGGLHDGDRVSSGLLERAAR